MKTSTATEYNALVRHALKLELDEHNARTFLNIAYRGLLLRDYPEAFTHARTALRNTYSVPDYIDVRFKQPLFLHHLLDESHQVAVESTIYVQQPTRERFLDHLERFPNLPKPAAKWEKEGGVDSYGISYTELSQDIHTHFTLPYEDDTIEVRCKFHYVFRRPGLPSPTCRIETSTHTYHTVACDLKR